MTAYVENHLPLERGDPRLKVSFGSDGNRISRASCIFEISVGNAVGARYACVECLCEDSTQEAGWYHGLCLVPFGMRFFLS